jgi:hypothetical protein
MWRTILVPAVLVIGGCHVRRVDFMTRVQEDCLAGQQWACDLINSLSKPPPIASASLNIPSVRARAARSVANACSADARLHCIRLRRYRRLCGSDCNLSLTMNVT